MKYFYYNYIEIFKMKKYISIALIVLTTSTTSAINLSYVNKGFGSDPPGPPDIKPTSFHDNNNCNHVYDYSHSVTGTQVLECPGGGV